MSASFKKLEGRFGRHCLQVGDLTQLLDSSVPADSSLQGLVVSNFRQLRYDATDMPKGSVNLNRESDAGCAGQRNLECEERGYEAEKAELVALRVAIDEGDASGVAEGNVFGRVRKALRPKS